MKLAFIGTHGTGKTTLCYDLTAGLKRQGLNADMVKEVGAALAAARSTARRRSTRRPGS